MSVAVGTDSLASNHDLDVLAELPVLREIALTQGDSGLNLDEWLVTAATAGGAAALGRADLGGLHPGAHADFAVFAVDPGSNPYTSLVNGAGRCTATMTGGRLRQHR
jgi:cytosine/adenosine deaminase-related metal-dependent hydrolase